MQIFTVRAPAPAAALGCTDGGGASENYRGLHLTFASDAYRRVLRLPIGVMRTTPCWVLTVGLDIA
jgi:hypothetical protein